MIEVETKARINNPSKLRVEVQKLRHYKGKERKIDDYYTLESIKHYPKKSLRIRKKSGSYEINFKHLLSFNDDIYVKKENEFKIIDVAPLIKLINEFGFKKWLTKEKYTELYEIKKNFHIELNNVKKLGWFIEIEYLCTPPMIKTAQHEIKLVLKKLGIRHKDIIKEGYTKLLWDKKR